MTGTKQPLNVAVNPLANLNIEDLLKQFKFENYSEADKAALINMGANKDFKLDAALIDKFMASDLNNKDNWLIFEIKHLKLLFAEYEDTVNKVYFSVKSCEYEGELAYVISFSKSQILIKGSGAQSNLDPSVFVDLDYCKDYILEILDHYLDVSGDGIGSFPASQLINNIYK